MVTDKALLKEVTKELWQSVKKLRPDLGKDPRMQLVLKALITIGDLPNPIEAAMVVGTWIEMEGEAEEEATSNKGKQSSTSTDKSAKESETTEGRRVVRRRSSSG
mgnify:CR=1 FL=1